MDRPEGYFNTLYSCRVYVFVYFWLLHANGLVSKCLTPAQIEQYREEGCVFPIRVISETEAAQLRGRIEAFEQRTGGPLKGDLRHKSHLLFVWLAELVRCRSILAPSRISTARTCCAGPPTSLSRRR